ncbi:MAG TPA: aconitase X catalytic domain-containing protein [Gammaproteobacteria bacterium]|jgi:predicted aconitase|nr:aconitase X catalytic domain-containing protein [Gammaproteobacteria bacterium]
MQLTDEERALLDGHGGKARQKAMELLVRYAEALGAERFVITTNVAGVPGQGSVFLANYYKTAGGSRDAIFSHFDLDSDELIEMPPVVTHSCHLQGGYDPENWQLLGATEQAAQVLKDTETYAAEHGVQILKTCTPYLVGNVPKLGEHCAWMESSAVIYCNSVLGARTNTEGRESTSAAMLTGRIPDFGFHQDHYRRGTHKIEVDVAVDSLMDWGMLGYFVGEVVGERIPVLDGRLGRPDLVRHKHFGAAAASSGGVEMYHIVGMTPEAPTESAAFGGNRALETFRYGAEERRRVYERLNSNARDPNVDYVMLGCPHAALEQIAEACTLLAGRRISANCRLWIFTSRAIKQQADRAGYTGIIRAAGGHVLTDTCSAIGQALPPGTKVAALDSAKQVHYLPAIMGIQAWFGSTADCIDAALTGRWNGQAP